MKSKNGQNGYSLVEILVVVLVFTILGVLVSQIIALSLRGSRKSESVGSVRENVDYAVNVMERHLRNAEEISSCSSTTVDYVDGFGDTGRFSCVTSGGESYIASGSALPRRLTSPDIEVICSGYDIFNCPPASPGVPPSVVITIKAQEATLGGTTEGAQIEERTRVLLRSY